MEYTGHPKRTIANGESVSKSLELANTTLVGLITPGTWSTAALTIEVSVDDSTFYGVVYDENLIQCNSIASPVVSTPYALNPVGMLPWRFIRIRSGTTASPVNQAGDRVIQLITRPTV